MSRVVSVQRVQRGFSLIELLIAMTILALVASVMSSSIRFSINTASVVEARVAAAETDHLVHRALRRHLQLARPVGMQDEDGDWQVDFEASRNSVSFIAPAPEALNVTGLVRIRLDIVNDSEVSGDAGQLLIQFEPYRQGRTGATRRTGDSRVILDGFGRAEFAYFDAKRRPSGQWVDAWQYADRLPDLVRLRVLTRRDAGEDTVELVIATKANAVVREAGV